MSASMLRRVKDARTSGAVLKVRLSNIRSRFPAGIVLVFEGDDDVGPYGAWISRIDDHLIYEPLPGKGKGQLLDLRRRLQSDTNQLAAGVFFFVDRDFDDLRGQAPGWDIYTTDSYSIENDLVTEHTCIKVLSDEFRCTAETDDRANALATYRLVAARFACAMESANRRIFRARKLDINADIIDSVSKYVDIRLDEVNQKYDDSSIKLLVKLQREPTAEECALIDDAFSLLDPLTRYRGKFWLAFFFRWLEELASERRQCSRKIFSSAIDFGFASSNISLAALAIKSRIPVGLAEFVTSIARSRGPSTG